MQFIVTDNDIWYVVPFDNFKNIINAIVNAVRDDEELYIPKWVPKAVQAAEEYKRKHGLW